jgi:hypothetical protein
VWETGSALISEMMQQEQMEYGDQMMGDEDGMD